MNEPVSPGFLTLLANNNKKNLPNASASVTLAAQGKKKVVDKYGANSKKIGAMSI